MDSEVSAASSHFWQWNALALIGKRSWPAGAACLQTNRVKLKLDSSEVLDGHDHVIEDGDVLPVHGEEPLEVDQRPDLCEDREEDGVRGMSPEAGHEGAHEAGQGLAEADVPPVLDTGCQPHGLRGLLESED